jgi:hypothetical protein
MKTAWLMPFSPSLSPELPHATHATCAYRRRDTPDAGRGSSLAIAGFEPRLLFSREVTREVMELQCEVTLWAREVTAPGGKCDASR